MRVSRSAAGALIALLALLAVPARATLSEALSLAELVRQSDHVVRVTCLSERALRDDRERIVTDYTLRVEEVRRGPLRPGAEIVMRRLGGELGDLGMRVEGEPRLAPGGRYIVFLYAVRGVLRPVGMSQGVLPVTDEGGVLVVHPGGAGLSLVLRGADGRLAPAPPALQAAEPWDRLRARVDAVRGAP
ncbi:MAG: hypothetical protein KF729_13490 [Sandaracinaceae bacterium]|nr:hypothetical protein [Sandaracinaceae bacterium]